MADILELSERHNVLIAKVNGFTKLTINLAIVAFICVVVLCYFVDFKYVLLLIVAIFVPVYVIAYRSAKKEIIAQIQAIESTDGMSVADKKTIGALKERHVMLVHFWGFKR